MLNGVGLFYCANYKNHWILVSYSVKIGGHYAKKIQVSYDCDH